MHLGRAPSPVFPHHLKQPFSLLFWWRRALASHEVSSVWRTEQITRDSDSESSYSHATVVDVRAFARPTSERLADATADTLDYKPSRCALADTLRPILALHLTAIELAVAEWALCAAAARAAAAATAEAAYAPYLRAPKYALPQAPRPSEAAVRAVATGLLPTCCGPVATATAHMALPRDARRLRVALPFALALLATACALARLQLQVRSRRAPRGRASMRARGARASIRIEVLGSMPALVIVRRAPFDSFFARSQAAKEEAEDMLADIAELVDDFAAALALP